jgi:hypothetical protein
MTGENTHVAETPDTDPRTAEGDAVRFVGQIATGTTVYTEWFTDASESHLSGVKECLRLRGWVDLRRETRGEMDG